MEEIEEPATRKRKGDPKAHSGGTLARRAGAKHPAEGNNDLDEEPATRKHRGNNSAYPPTSDGTPAKKMRGAATAETHIRSEYIDYHLK